ncbi:hypothetical protein M427DRAFT_67089 [Gonapodya prolifera JEL478]|uniref:P-loop containing nucleoside triphosphate hydrolase protein n=1 Tax=Gonapodya prolifera (strain JEL478) TaxID=1344416 RepID=A0A139ASH5_GONPJ|nr:hypothetical protein M427DRAFT_67089 [Gonapodya prolifera JEL478]|eukprot:KXS19435.1 hypothetical protein M427DRAFT_67089 [Gonapodya prolifera JEL478]
MVCSGPLFDNGLFSSCFIALAIPTVLISYIIISCTFRYVSILPRRLRLPESDEAPRPAMSYLSLGASSSVLSTFHSMAVLVVLVEALGHLNRGSWLLAPYLLAGALLNLAAWLSVSAIYYAEASTFRRQRKAARASASVRSNGNAGSSSSSHTGVNGGELGAKHQPAGWDDIGRRWSVVPGFWIVALLADGVIAYQWAVLLSLPSDGAPPNFFNVTVFAARLIFEIIIVCTWAISKLVLSLRTYSPVALEDGNHATASPQPEESSTFDDFYDKMIRLLPYIWPSKSLKLQLLVLLNFAILIAGRIVNVLVVFQYKHVIDSLDTSVFAWGSILLYVFFRFLQGGVGLLSSLQSLSWISIGQYTTRVVSLDLFSHLHGLSLQWHLQRKTGEVLRIMDRGTSSIVSLLNYIVFNIFPVFADIAIACGVFLIAFDWSIAIVVFLTMTLYIVFTILITEWRTSFRREMIELDNATRTRSVDSLLNFETVKYYGNEDYEVKEYEKAIVAYQAADWRSSASLTMLNTAQNAVITLGLLAGCLLCAKEVVDGALTVGDFVMFLTYLLQLYGPLNWFGTYYRAIQQSFIDMEKMLDLFKEHSSVQDAPDATELVLDQGHVVFDHVSFEYDKNHPAIKDISFDIPPGKSVALDTVLFNDTVKNNIRYAKVDASDEEVENAAKIGQIHERILSFKDGYSTKVGERGLRLSGGEKQRVAIARTVLKNPRILLLDEATSALDTVTERLIQDAMGDLAQNRTTLIIAHRLSTIVGVDKVIVLQNGTIAEQGTHSDLLAKKGLYFDLWTQQLKEADEARNHVNGGTVATDSKKHA